jgi:DNA-binding Lrp family transcriptional regulator
VTDVPHNSTEHRLDDVDRRILYALMGDARDTTAAEVAETVNVSAATVRNRIHNLEDAGVISGYTAQVDFERAGGKLTNLYLCNVPVARREALAHEARAIPGVVHVRVLMTGRRNLHVLAVGEDTNDLQRIARRLSNLGIEVEDEDLVADEFFDPYGPFAPDQSAEAMGPNDVISLTGDANVIEVTVDADAPIAGSTLEDASSRGVIGGDTLVIAIERDDLELTPHGDSVVRPDDIVTVLSRAGASDDTLDPFQAPGDGASRTPSDSARGE